MFVHNFSATKHAELSGMRRINLNWSHLQIHKLNELCSTFWCYRLFLTSSHLSFASLPSFPFTRTGGRLWMQIHFMGTYHIWLPNKVFSVRWTTQRRRRRRCVYNAHTCCVEVYWAATCNSVSVAKPMCTKDFHFSSYRFFRSFLCSLWFFHWCTCVWYWFVGPKTYLLSWSHASHSHLSGKRSSIYFVSCFCVNSPPNFYLGTNILAGYMNKSASYSEIPNQMQKFQISKHWAHLYTRTPKQRQTIFKLFTFTTSWIYHL